MSQVRSGALYFIGVGVLAIVAALGFVVYEQNSEWARDGIEVEAQVTGIHSLLSTEVDVVYVDESGRSHTGVVTVAKTQLSRPSVQVQYLGTDPERVRSKKNPWGIAVAASIVAMPLIVLGSIAYWGTKKYPNLANEHAPPS